MTTKPEETKKTRRARATGELATLTKVDALLNELELVDGKAAAERALTYVASRRGFDLVKRGE
jgi:hypothetical protein